MWHWSMGREALCHNVGCSIFGSGHASKRVRMMTTTALKAFSGTSMMLEPSCSASRFRRSSHEGHDRADDVADQSPKKMNE